MRLVCPSCSAEYEVDEAAIGARGRMVRCASCSSEWFQAPAVGAEAPQTPEPVAAPAPAPEPAPEPEPAPAPPVVEPAKAEEADDPYASLRAEFAQAAPEPEPTYRVEPQAPFAEESQPSERIYFDEEPPVIEGAAAGAIVEETRVRSRRGTEPEDLAASLREADDGPSGGGGSFLAGFATVTLLALIMIAVYVKAPDIAALAPAAEGPLAAYAEAVNKGRVAIASFIGG